MPTFTCLAIITTLNRDTKSTSHLIISPGQGHEINFGEDMMKMLPENGVAVGDRGFCSHKLFAQFIANDTLFIIRIKSQLFSHPYSRRSYES
jgi:hypothetical protein